MQKRDANSLRDPFCGWSRDAQSQIARHVLEVGGREGGDQSAVSPALWRHFDGHASLTSGWDISMRHYLGASESGAIYAELGASQSARKRIGEGNGGVKWNAYLYFTLNKK